MTMKMLRLCRLAILTAAALALLHIGSGVAQADRVVQSNEAIIISNDITNSTTNVVSTSGTLVVPDPSAAELAAGDVDNAAGMADGTNPNQGKGTDHSPIGGTNNPNQSGK